MGAYSPYPREINIYFLQGELYILPGYISTGIVTDSSTGRVAKERDETNKKRERARENVSKTEHLRAIRSYCETVAITLSR